MAPDANRPDPSPPERDTGATGAGATDGRERHDDAEYIPRTRLGRRLVRDFRNPRSYGLLLVAMVITYSLSVGLPEGRAKSLIVLAQLVTVWLALRASDARVHLRRATEFLMVVALVTGIIHGVDGSQASPGFVFLASGLLYIVVPFTIIRHVVLRPKIDEETVLGALCAYLCIGMAFAFFYRFLGAVQSTLFFGTTDGTLSDDLFFSFVTLTTTGYGNLVPSDNPGQSLAVLEALVGQLFLITAVGKVVTAWQPKRWRTANDSGAAPAGGEPGPGPTNAD